MTRHTRRAFLVTATAAAAGAAGCVGIGGVDDSGSDPDETRSDPDETTDGPVETTGGDPTTTGSGGGSTDTGSSFETFEDLKRWYTLDGYGSASAAKEDAYAGSQSMRLEAGDGPVAAYRAFPGPQDLSGKNFSIAVKLENPRSAKLQVELHAPDRGNKISMTRTLLGPTGEWMRVDLGTTEELRDPDLTSVQEIRIIGRPLSGSGGVKMAVDDLRLVDRPGTGYVMLSFDDVMRSHYETAFPIMEEFGFSGVEGVVQDAVYGEDRLDVGMMREMRDAGWDMASLPPAREYLYDLSPEEQRAKVEANKQFLVRKGFQDGARHFITPNRFRGPKTMDIVREHHETLFTFGGMPNALPSTTRYNYSRINASDSEPVRNLVDLAADYGQLLVATTQDIGIGSDDSMTEREFRSFLEYVDSANVKVVTASDLLEM